jgi:hypothetical protein
MRPMREVVVLACILAGCGLSKDLGSGDALPSGDATTADTAGPSNDVDGDGVVNTSDNCPTKSNPMQFNEDGDATGDECDPCPQFAAASADADDDSDGVGNGCDPRRNTPGDVLAYWNGFHEASTTLPAPLEVIHGSVARWSIAGGNLVYTRVDEDWGIVAVDVASSAHTVDLDVEITAAYGVSFAAAAGAVVDVAQNDASNFVCEARIDGGGARELWRWNTTWSVIQVSNVITPLTSYRVTVQRNLDGLTCRTERATSNAPVTLASTQDTSQNTRAGVFARNTDSRYRYLAIYTIAPQ